MRPPPPLLRFNTVWGISAHPPNPPRTDEIKFPTDREYIEVAGTLVGGTGTGNVLASTLQ